MKWYERVTTKQYILIIIGLLAIQVVGLYLQGHIAICECGTVDIWHGELNDAENSQHLSDWYTFSHIIHGFVFYWLLQKFTRKRLPGALLLVLAVLIEVGWEILENSPLIINRYRETAALLYYGDSILNSVSDTFAMMFGFIIAKKSPVWVSIAFLVAMELFVLFMIRDNLVLNVVMLLHPFEFIKNWQIGL